MLELDCYAYILNYCIEQNLVPISAIVLSICFKLRVNVGHWYIASVCLSFKDGEVRGHSKFSYFL